MTSERRTQSLIHRAIGSRAGVRLFRNQTGVGWYGDVERVDSTTVLVRNARQLRSGLCPGSSDLVGWQTVDGVARFVALEVKSPAGRTTRAQSDFLIAVDAAGGCAGVVRSVEDATRILDGA